MSVALVSSKYAAQIENRDNAKRSSYLAKYKF
jgi:hypothetical protein